MIAYQFPASCVHRPRRNICTKLSRNDNWIAPFSRIVGDQSGPQENAVVSRFMTYTALGDPEDVRNSLAKFQKETAADEIILTAQIFDHAARLRAFEIAAEAAKSLDG